jgi:hypothetical protein
MSRIDLLQLHPVLRTAFPLVQAQSEPGRILRTARFASMNKSVIFHRPRLSFCLTYSTAPDWKARGQFRKRDRAPMLTVYFFFVDFWVRLPWFHYERAKFADGHTGIDSSQRSWGIYLRPHYGHLTCGHKVRRLYG